MEQTGVQGQCLGLDFLASEDACAPPVDERGRVGPVEFGEHFGPRDAAARGGIEPCSSEVGERTVSAVVLGLTTLRPLVRYRIGPRQVVAAEYLREGDDGQRRGYGALEETKTAGTYRWSSNSYTTTSLDIAVV